MSKTTNKDDNAHLKSELAKLQESLKQARRNQRLYEQALERLNTAEASLNKEKTFSENLLATLQAVIVLLDEQANIVYINPFMERQTGFRFAEVKGKKWFETFIPPRDRKKVRKLFDKAIGGSQTKGNINAILSKTGEERMIQWFDQLLEKDNGGGNWLLSTGVDVTELEQERATSWRIEHRFRTLIDALPQGIFLKNTKLAYVACNRSHARFLGLESPKEIIGRRDKDFFPAELTQRFRDDDMRVMESGESLDVEEPTILNGQETLVQTVKTPMYDEAGNLSGILGIYWDISGRKKMELQLRQSMSLLESTLESTADGIVAVSMDGRIDKFNRRFVELWGIPDEVLESRSHERAIAFVKDQLADPQAFVDGIRDLKQRPDDESFDVLYFRDGRVFERFTFPQRVGDETIGRVVSFRDLTEHYRHEGMLQARLQLTDMAAQGDHRQLMRATLDWAEGLTGSCIGFFHFVEENQEDIWLQAWSTNTTEKMCTAEGAGQHYPVSDAGVWANAIREKRPVIYNDFANLPDKKGMPEGHAEVLRLVSVPVIRGGKVVAAIGIGNKPVDYVDADTEVVSQLANLAWDMIEVKKAEAALKQSEHRYSTLFEAVTDAVFVHPILADGEPGHFIEVNDEACRYTGYARDELLAMGPVDLDVPDSGVEAGEVGVRMLAAGSTTFEQLHVAKDGRHIPVEVHAQLFDLEGQKAVFSLVRDISGRKQAEEALRLSEETYRSLFDNMLNGLSHCRMLFDDGGTPQDFIYLRVNDNFAKLTGLTDVIGRRVSEVIPGIVEQDPELIRIYGGVARGGEPQRFETYVNSLDMWFSISAYSPKPDHFVAVFDVITERKQAEIALAHANRALMALGTVNRELVHASNEADLLQAICTAIVEQRGYHMAWVGYVQHNEQRGIVRMASAGVAEEVLEQVRPEWATGSGPIGRAIRSGGTQIVRRIAEETRNPSWTETLTGHGCVSGIVLPLQREDGEVFGILDVYAEEEDAFTDKEVALLEEMAGDMAFGVSVLRIRLERDNALRLDELHLAQLHENLEETVVAISKAVEARDPYTSGHQRRVAELAVAIGRQMGLDEEQLEGLRLGAIIHDIGKIHLPAEILSKPGRLNEVEYMIVKEHPKVGFEILKDIHFPWPVAEIAHQHHERFDGSGYPRGLKGNEISLEARIVAVADVVEAMSSHRPYRPGLGLEKALTEIRTYRGEHYCPESVDACLTVFDCGFGFA